MTQILEKPEAVQTKPVKTAPTKPVAEALPDDLYEISTGMSEAAAFKSLEEQGADARAARIDLVGRLWQEEAGQGKGSWRARVQHRLGLDEDGQQDGANSKKSIGDYAKIFELFRLKPPHGLGYSRTLLSQHQPGRLRVFAQNADWALKNPDRVIQMLVDGRNEGHLRKEVQEAKEAEITGLPEKEVWETVTLRMTPAAAATLRSILGGVRLKQEQTRGMVFSKKEGVAMGEVAFALAGEWYHATDVINGPSGVPFSMENVKWVEQAAETGTEPDGDEASTTDSELNDNDGF